MFKLIQLLLNTNRYKKRIITISYDIFAILISFYIAISLCLNALKFEASSQEIIILLVTEVITITCFIRLGMYRAVLRYITLPAVGYIFLAIIISSSTLGISNLLFATHLPYNISLIYMGLITLSLGGPRILIRTLYYQYFKRRKPNVFVYGAGATGRDLVSALIQGSEYHPVVILEDDQAKVGQILLGIRVHHSSEFQSLQMLYKPEKLLIAINNISSKQRLNLLNKIAQWPIAIQSVPSVEDIAIGKAQASDVQDLNIEDLLGRTPVDADNHLLSRNIHNKSVMITGAGGSIGSELCRQALRQNPLKLVLFELNEYNLYRIDQELQSLKLHLGVETEIISALGSVQDGERVKQLLQTYRINTFYHAAAYKHVPIIEDNIIEGIKNNVFGTLSCAQAASESGVENFTLISTDKVVRPTSIMGATKRIAELILQAMADNNSATTYTMVRFGNVLGSSGSVVPLFKQQIKKGGPITVTHPQVIRYFMLIPEAAQLVIQASAMGGNGQVYVLDMGEPVKILDLAKRMIHLMGKQEKVKGKQNPDGIEIKFTGLRPGEKLYEELLIGNNVESTVHKKILTAKEGKLPWKEVESILNKLDLYCHCSQIENIKYILFNSSIEIETH